MVFSPLPGTFSFQCWGGTFLSALGEGHAGGNALVTSALSVGPNEKFTIWADGNRLAFQTAHGAFVTAVGGGGRTSDVMHADADAIGESEQFTLVPKTVYYRSILTVRNRFLTAVGAGGQGTDAIHSDALDVGRWETFRVRHHGELGSGYTFYFLPEQSVATLLYARDGGGRTSGAFGLGHIRPGDAGFRVANLLDYARFTLTSQPGGSYAVRTSTGNYVTAVSGGDLPADVPGGTLHTDATQVRAWERFLVVEHPDGSYVFRTEKTGHYLALTTLGYDPTNLHDIFRTDVPDPDSASRFLAIYDGV